MDENSVLWSRILEKIKNKIYDVYFDTWFSETELFKLEDNTAKIIISFPFQRDHLTKNYNDLIQELLFEETGIQYKIEYVTKEELDNENKEKIEENKEDENKPFIKRIHNSNLNKKYTFDNFVVGEPNKFARAAAVAVAENPGSTYNPLFLYGNSGLGKTHLMYAIGNFIEDHSDKKVLYITSETFSNDFIDITRKKDNKSDFDNIAYFKKKYREVDVLIIDDIQYLEKKVESQKEFFHTFNNLYTDDKQIIISSDRSPNDFKMFEDNLKTRFSWGLTVNLLPPDYELKMAILKKIIKSENLTDNIPENVIEYIAANAGTNIRSLIGTLTVLLAYSSMLGKEINLESAVEALKNNLNSGYSEKNDISKIQKLVADYFKISIEELKSKKKNSNIVFPRQVAIYLCRKYTDESLSNIGKEFGGKNHSTVVFTCKKINKMMIKDKAIEQAITKLENDLKK